MSKLLAGCRRSGRSCDGRWPLTVPVLTHIVQILPDVCLSQFEAQLFRAVMLCAFFGFMRIGEFAAISRYRTQRSLLLDTDVHFQALGQPDASVFLTFRHTKTNQVGPPQVVRLVQCEDMRVCPVRALIAFAQVRPNLPGSFSVISMVMPLLSTSLTPLPGRHSHLWGLKGHPSGHIPFV